MSEWRITRLRGGLALTFDRDGRRRRYALGTNDPRKAHELAPALYNELTRPSGRAVKDLWSAYCAEKKGIVTVETMGFTWRALNARFAALDGEMVTPADCEAHIAERRAAGRSDGTIHTELGHLRTVLRWAAKKRLIGSAPEIPRPLKPDPKDLHMTKQQAAKILTSTKFPHVRLAMHLMLATAARVTAVLELTWDRIDLDRRLIYLRDPEDKTKRKGRAIVPINSTLLAVLREARSGAMTDHVVEWAGDPVKSLKKGIASAATAAGLEWVTPHVFRHTAAVWMAEAGVPMEEISQYLGHSNVDITRRVYARYSPDYLRKAASALEIGLYEVPPGSIEPVDRNGRAT